jgi:chemotaxis protein CheX
MTPFSDTSLPATAFDRTTWTPLLELSAREVFDIMLCTKLRSFDSPPEESEAAFTALVGLAGSLCGVLSIRCNDQAARVMASKMLGMPPEEVDNDSWDALGEIANMIAATSTASSVEWGITVCYPCPPSSPEPTTRLDHSVPAIPSKSSLNSRTNLFG